MRRYRFGGRAVMNKAPSSRVLFVSNGHGEDDIACKVLDQLRPLVEPGLSIEAWPMVGSGQAYRDRGIAIAGPSNTLPGEGFGTLSLSLFLRDLRSGFIATHWRQLRYMRAVQGRYRLLVGVGDIVPLTAAWLGKTPMAFIACAKSAYYGGLDGQTGAERSLMRNQCVAVFPRDVRTAAGLIENGVPCQYLGNPMMDGLMPTNPQRFTGHDTINIAMLAGSRQDATDNALFLLQAARRLSQTEVQAANLRFLFACHPAVDLSLVATAATTLDAGWVQTVWDNQMGPMDDYLCLQNANGSKALLIRGALADILHSARLVVGLAGTANEQAIGLGIPLVTLPGAGNQGKSYVRMKMRFFGDAAIAVTRNPDDVAQTVATLLADPERCKRMAVAGRERMGAPGASLAIAHVIRDTLVGPHIPNAKPTDSAR